MNKTGLTLAEARELRDAEIERKVTITKPLVEIPEGIYSGKFLTQQKTVDKKKILSPVIDYITYERGNKPMGFFVAKADLQEQTSGKGYSNVNIGITDALEEKLDNPADLVRDYDFRSKMGRLRTFVSVEA